MRVLFASTSGAGHIQPMLPLALALRDRGHELLWATGPDGCEWVAAAGIDSESVGISTAERTARFQQRWPEAASLRGEERVAHMFPRLFGAVAAPAAFPDLLAVGRRWKPDVVVSEAADLAAPVVAAALGVPQVTHGFGLVVPPERVSAAADEAASLWESVSLPARPYGGCYDHLYIDVYPPSLQPDDLSYIGRIQRRRPESHTAVESSSDADSVVQAALTDGRSLVYLTFGTLFNDNPTFEAAVAAVARLDDVVVVVTVGPDGDPQAFGPQPDHVHVTRYVSQDALLPHCAAVVSHAGSGTLLGALGRGVPQVCLPQAADQLRNAAACAAAGAAIALFGDDATTDAVEKAVRAVLGDPSYRAAAERIREEIEAMPGVDAAAEAVEALVRTGGSR